MGSHAFAGSGRFCRVPVVGAAACAWAPGDIGFSAPVLPSGCTRVGSIVARGVTSSNASCGLPPFCPEDELPAIAHLNEELSRICALRRAMRPRGYPVRRDRYLKFRSLVLGGTRRNDRRRPHATSRLI